MAEGPDAARDRAAEKRGGVSAVGGPRYYRLRELARIQSGGTPARKTAQYWEGGSVPWITTAEINQGRIANAATHITPLGLANSSAKIFPRGTVLVAMYGQGKTRGSAAILDIEAATNQACVALISRPIVDSEYLYQFMSHSYEALRSLSNSGGQNNLSAAIVGSFEVWAPPLPEQRKIGEILRTWDDAIASTVQLRGRLAARGSALGDRLVAPTRPVKRKLRELTSPITVRNAGALGREVVMGVSNRDGLVPMRTQTIAADISRYQVLPSRAFTYNPMRINVGSIAMSRRSSNVLVSPDYVLFACDETTLLPEYLDHVLKTNWWLHYVNAGASGSVRTRTYYDDLAAIAIHAPAVDEQARIARTLDAMCEELALLDREIKLLRTQKRGLMQKLLTGEVRVNAGEPDD